MQWPMSLWHYIHSPRTVAFHHRLNRKWLSQSPPFAHCTYTWHTNRAAELPEDKTKLVPWYWKSTHWNTFRVFISHAHEKSENLYHAKIPTIILHLYSGIATSGVYWAQTLAYCQSDLIADNTDELNWPRSQAIFRSIFWTANVTFELPREAAEGLVCLLRHQTARWTRSWHMRTWFQ